ncbi:distal tail protein Dit [Risungbinella massiliensis]|uniref:distal tail protein Dit n=1 Tax=Risungbinella massiliensis TaxID=1329796 RepID=UPI0005CC0467|nr:distal tail protein Dit [Risungbinella massiliensis]
MAIKFNEIDVPAFVLVNDLKVSILPTIRPDLLKIKGRSGSYDFGFNIEERMIEIDVTIEAATRLELRQHIRELAQWLYYDDAKPLVILDEPDKYYLAKVSGDTDLSEMITIGQGSISFVCSDPFLYGEEKVVPFSPVDTEPVTVSNTGGMEAFPKFEFTFDAAVPNFSIIADDQRMDFGTPAKVGETDPVPARNLLFREDGSSTANFTSGLGVDNGTIAGQLVSNGSVIYQENHDFGDPVANPGWHGGALVRSFGKLVSDFTIESQLTLNSFNPDQVGRIEIYLLDANNTRVGCVALCDFNLGLESPHIQVRAGEYFSGTYFVNTDFAPGRWRDFDGKITFQRKDQWWYFSIVRGTNGVYYDRWSTQWYDKDYLYMDDIAAIQIHVGTFGALNPPSYLHFDWIEAWEENYVDPSSEVPEIFIPGDTLTIDSATGTIEKNGEPFFSELALSSSFIRLKKGVNNIQITPAAISNGSITYRERWL